MAKISERIKEAMEARNMKQSELAEKAKVNAGALSCWINDKYDPKQKSIYKLARALDVSELWLLGDETVPMEKYHQINLGDILGDEKLKRELSARRSVDDPSENNFTEDEIYLVEVFRSLDSFGQETVMAVLEKESERCRSEEEFSIPFSVEELRKLPLEQRLKFEPYIDDGLLMIARKRKR